LIGIAKECVMGVSNGGQEEVKDHTVEQQELAAYFTHCNIQKVHLRLALLNTIGVC